MTRSAVLTVLALVLAGPALSQPNAAPSDWPNRPVKLIVPFPAGSAADLAARVVGQRLGSKLGQQIVIDNRAGASGTIGIEAAARAAPDGYTIAWISNTTNSIAPNINAKLGYRPVEDFAPVSMIGVSPYVLAVRSGLPAKNVQELIALAKAKPGSLSYASAGQTSLANLAATLFAKLAGIEFTHVPYRSSNQAVVDLVEGRIDMQFGTIGPTLPFIRDGKMRALAVTGEQPIDLMPGVPTVAASGLPGYEATVWMALALPAGTPAEIVERLSRETRSALGADEVKTALSSQGMQPSPSTSEALKTRMTADLEKWRQVIASGGIKAQ